MTTKQNRARQVRVRQVGIAHALLLIFVVLSVTLWGMSELLRRAADQKQDVENASVTTLETARESLIDYALLPPARIADEQDQGRYNAYTAGDDDSYPFRLFSLPCPVVAADDTNLDGVSDILSAHCAGGGIAPLASKSRFGRLPWRSAEDLEGGDFQSIRGVLDSDLRDGYNQRFWYVVSDNLLPQEDPLNPHNLLRMTTGWLTVRSEAGLVLSDRVAAVVIAPGLFGNDDASGRVAEDTLFGGEGEKPYKIPAANISVFHENYLDNASYAQLVAGVGEVTLVNKGNDPSADQIRYLTIDELALDGGAGIQLLEKNNDSLYALLEGREDFLGVEEMFEEHLNRYGYLPTPATFSDKAVDTTEKRPSGFAPLHDAYNVTIQTSTPIMTTVEIDSALTVAATAKLTVVAFARALPPVYFVTQIKLESESDIVEKSNEIHIPYNVELVDMDTRLNSDLLPVSVATALKTDKHYPTVSPLGIKEGGLFEIDYSGALSKANINTDALFKFSSSGDSQIPVALSEPIDAYILTEKLEDISAFADGLAHSDFLNSLPPYATRVRLPAGTQLSINASDFLVQFPANAKADAAYDPENKEWLIDKLYDAPARVLVTNKAALVTLNGLVANGANLRAGDFGWLPIESTKITIHTAAGRVDLPATQPITRLANDMLVYTKTSLTVVPFLPAGQPHVLPDAFVGMPSPVIIPANSEVMLPQQSEIIYAKNGSFKVGVDFAFPDNSVVKLPRNAVITVNLPPNTILPYGKSLGNAAIITQSRYTLSFGGYVQLNNTKPVLAETDLVGAKDKNFNMEIREEAVWEIVDTDNSSTLILTLEAGEVFRPFTGGRLTQSPKEQLQDGDILISPTPVRGGFYTRPRFIPYTERAAVVESFGQAVTITSFRKLGNSNAETAVASLSLTMVFDENSEFIFPADHSFVFKANDITATLQTVTVMDNIVLPEKTGLFSPNSTAIELFADYIDVNERPLLGHAITVSLATKTKVGADEVGGVIKSHFMLYPESDLYWVRGGALHQVVKADSLIDLTEGSIYSPNGLRRLPRVPENSEVISNENMHLYFTEEVTLRLGTEGGIAKGNSLPPYYHERFGLGKVSLTLRYVEFNNLPSTGIPTVAVVTAGVKPVVPAGAFLMIPSGSAVEVFSRASLTTSADELKYEDSIIPAGSALSIPSGEKFVLDNGLKKMTISGPAYVGTGQLDESNKTRWAFLNKPDFTQKSPIIFLDGEAYFRDKTEGDLRNSSHNPIPSDARLDLFGYMEMVPSGGFHLESMPIDSRTFYENFPMLYAVAPECQAGNKDGENCAEGDEEGLTFIMEEGSEYLLEENMVAPKEIVLTASVPNVSLKIAAGNISTVGITATIFADSALVASDGAVSLHNPSTPFGLNAHDKLIIEAAESNIDLRAYIGATNFVDSVDDLTYAELDTALTVYVGGYVNSQYDDAFSIVTLAAGSIFDIGVGSRLSVIEDEKGVFGDNSIASITVGGVSGTAVVDLSDYVVISLDAYDMRATLFARGGMVDAHGVPYIDNLPFLAGEVVGVEALDSERNNAIEILPRDDIITVAADAEILMDSGYLWQGYIPSRSTLHLVSNANKNKYDLPGGDDNPHAVITTQWPSDNAYLRVQSTVTLLNMWGTGLERPEGIDGNSSVALSITSFTNVTIDSGIHAANTVGYLANTVTASISIAIRVYRLNSSGVVAGTALVAVANYDPRMANAGPFLRGLRWNFKNHPFNDGGDNDYATADDQPIWAGGRDLHNAVIDNFMCHGVASTVDFNVPLWPLQVDENAPLNVAWNVLSNTIEPSALYDNSKTLGVIAQGVGVSFDFADAARDAYSPLATTVSYAAGLTTVSVATPTTAVTVNSDLFFYIDRAFKIDSLQTGFVIPQQKLKFGDNFEIGGPGAIVPPFGAQNQAALADVYAERSNLFASFFDTPALHTVYDEQTGDCYGTNDCSELFNNQQWLPIVNGVMSFELGANISVEKVSSSTYDVTDEVRLIMPQPFATVKKSDLSIVTIYAGSMIYPQKKVILPSKKIPAGDYELHLSGDAVAAVDVSPAVGLRPNLLVNENEVNVGKYAASPILVTTASGDCIIEPIGFLHDTLFNTFDGIGGLTTLTASIGIKSGTSPIQGTIGFDGSFTRGFLANDKMVGLMTSYYGGSSVFIKANGFTPSNLPTRTVEYNTDVPFGNPLSYRWVEGGNHFVNVGAERIAAGLGGVFSPAGVTVSTTGDEFEALRLAHRIDLSPTVVMSVNSYSDNIPYPSSASVWFGFPEDSDATILNTDAGSWLAANPHIARFLPGLEVRLSTASVLNTLTVSDENDGWRKVDVSNRKVLHYQHSERHEGLEPISNVPIYTNVWIRLKDGGSLIEKTTNDVIELPDNTIVNPIMGTYITSPISSKSGALYTKAENGYLTKAKLQKELKVMRAAYTLPVGTKMVIGEDGAELTNVKAAVLFSLTPLEDQVSCPSGLYSLNDGQPDRVDINQLREGATDSAYETDTGQKLRLGHPCLWLDDPENTDGDHVFVYRDRRRYSDSDLKFRTVSNDRTYVYGGRLSIN